MTRRSPPADMVAFIRRHGTPPASVSRSLIAQSVPVFVFGPTSARIATVGLNPGPGEFRATAAPWKWGHRAPEWSVNEPVGQRLAVAIDRHYQTYFACGSWKGDSFWRTTNALLPSRADFASGSACHIDLSPWATRVGWSAVPVEHREILLNVAASTMAELLAGPLRDVHTLVVRGAGAATALAQTCGDSGSLRWIPTQGRERVTEFRVKHVAVVAVNQFRAVSRAQSDWTRRRASALLKQARHEP